MPLQMRRTLHAFPLSLRMCSNWKNAPHIYPLYGIGRASSVDSISHSLTAPFLLEFSVLALDWRLLDAFNHRSKWIDTKRLGTATAPINARRIIDKVNSIGAHSFENACRLCTIGGGKVCDENTQQIENSVHAFPIQIKSICARDIMAMYDH